MKNQETWYPDGESRRKSRVAAMLGRIGIQVGPREVKEGPRDRYIGGRPAQLRAGEVVGVPYKPGEASVLPRITEGRPAQPQVRTLRAGEVIGVPYAEPARQAPREVALMPAGGEMPTDNVPTRQGFRTGVQELPAPQEPAGVNQNAEGDYVLLPPTPPADNRHA